MYWVIVTLLIALQLSSKCIYAYNILVISPTPCGSHGILGDGIVRILLKSGHEVTYISATTKMNQGSKLKVIDVSSNAKVFPDTFLNLRAMMNKESDMRINDDFYPVIDQLSLVTIKNDEVQKILTNESRHYDVVIAEWLYNELYAGVATVLGCPLIWLSPLEPHWLVLRIMDEASSPAYSSDGMSPNVIPFTFLQRVHELWFHISRDFYREFWNYNAVNKIFHEMYAPILTKRGLPVPSYEEVRYNGSLMLGNSYVAMGQATKLPQNYKSVGGFHIDKDLQPLTENLKNIMDEANHGVIYFSLGSNLRSADLPKDIKYGLLKLFGELTQNVLWKFEESLTPVPRNVHIIKWAPQQSILAHQNCILFISHGGLLSTTEAIHFGVPIIGIPVFADQFVNVLQAVNKGFAKKVDLTHTIVDELNTTVQEMLRDPRYHEKAKELSYIYHDRPLEPQKEVVHWVEHVIRTKGARHLRSPALLVPWYQKMYLDLIALIIAIVFTLKTFFLSITRKIKCVANKEKIN